MRKLILTIVLGGSMMGLMAQKPAGGEKNIEMNFTPLGGSPISISALKFRSFSSDASSALRLGLNIAMSNERESTEPATTGEEDPAIQEQNTTNSSFEIGLAPGYEMHWEGTDRLSPYGGAVLDFGMKTSNKTEEAYNYADEKMEETVTKGEDGWLRIGVNLVLGADWYFTDKVYLGTEVGFGLQMVSMSDVETTPPGDDAKTSTERGDSQMNIGPNFNGALRLGFLF